MLGQQIGECRADGVVGDAHGRWVDDYADLVGRELWVGCGAGVWVELVGEGGGYEPGWVDEEGFEGLKGARCDVSMVLYNS